MRLTLDLLDAADGAEIIHLRIGDRGRPAFAEAYAPS
jgi:hypothetical protein